MVTRQFWRRKEIYTVGLAGHLVAGRVDEAFFEMLAASGIAMLVDVRWQPASHLARVVDRSPLAEQTLGRGMKYLFLGHQLGGRPAGDRFYDDDGFVRYDIVAQSPEFLAGIKRIEREMAERTIALVCGEEDPTACHRRRLVGRVLETRGVDVLHLRADGRVQTDGDVAEEEAAHQLGTQRTLFEASEANSWKSFRAVLRKRRQPSFSGG